MQKILTNEQNLSKYINTFTVKLNLYYHMLENFEVANLVNRKLFANLPILYRISFS